MASGLLIVAVRHKLSLGELRSTTCCLESVLLSFLHTRVTGEKTCTLKNGSVVLVSGKERTSRTVADSACLTRETAALYGSNDIKLAHGLGSCERLIDDELEGLKTEIVINGTSVYGDNTGTGIKTNTSDRLLSSAGAVEIRLCTSIHYFSTILSLKLIRNRLLSLLIMSVACVNLEAGDCLVTDGVVREHTLYSELHCKLGTSLHKSAVLYFLQTTDVAGMVAIVLLSQLLAGQNSLGCVDNDYELTAINVGGEFRAMLAAKNVCSSNSGLTEGLTCSVNDVPFTLDAFGLCHVSGH